MASAAGLGSVIEQLFLWQVAGQLIGPAIAPVVQAELNISNSVSPVVPLTPADMADAVIRNIATEGEAAQEASFSGIDARRFGILTLLAGNAPDPTSLAEALRRGLIDEGRYMTGIRQGRLRDEWGELVKELAVRQPTPMDAMTALVEGQISEGDARAKYAAFGGDPKEFDWLFGTVGAGPSPLEAAEAAHRGVIPWGGKGLGVVSFEQAVAEGHTRNKWEPVYRALSEYLPPPRTITAMHREGALSTAEAATLLEKQGLSPTLAAAYLSASSKAKTVKAKELAESTVLSLYRDRIIPKAEAIAFLEKLQYTAAEAAYILQVEDLRVHERFVTAAVGRIHTLFVGHKIDATAAASALAGLKIDAGQTAELVALWDHERAANVRTLTPAQIEGAFGHGIIDQGTAQSLLVADGYTPHDAWVALSVHMKGALPDEPGASTVTPPAGP